MFILLSVCRFPMDVVFAIDSSYRLSSSEFAQEKSFIVTMIDAFAVSDSQTRVGVITFADTAREAIGLTSYTDATMLKASISSLPHNKQGTPGFNRVNGMLRKALEMFKDEGRAEVKIEKLIISDRI